MKQIMTVTREALKNRPLKHVIKVQTGTPPKKRKTEALAALLKRLKAN